MRIGSRTGFEPTCEVGPGYVMTWQAGSGSVMTWQVGYGSGFGSDYKINNFGSATLVLIAVLKII